MLGHSKRFFLGAVATLVAVFFTPTAQLHVGAQAPTLQVIASGLDNPRGIAFGPNGLLYVVEAGRGGTTMCAPNPAGPGDRCYGATGAITQISGIGVQQRVITGLPSLAGATGAEATGPIDIEFGFGSALLTIGWGGDPAGRAPFEAQGIHFGSLRRIVLTGQTSDLDLSAYEVAANPDGGAVDSNPYGLKILSDRGVFTDAGGNALLQIAPTGVISTLAVFPNRDVPGPGGMGIVPMQAVPTSVIEGPGGDLYVGELTGFPFPAGEARVYRVPADGSSTDVVADGFTNIIDMTIDSTGTVYVLEHRQNGILSGDTTGRLNKIGLFGRRTVIASTGLVNPGGVAIGPDNAAYVTIHSTEAGAGQVVRIPLTPVPE